MTRGAAGGFCWLVETIERTDVPQYRHFYPWRVTGQIVDPPRDPERFGWHVPDVADPAYVPAPGVVIPDAARTPNPFTSRKPRP
jgi:hypothetical protein